MLFFVWLISFFPLRFFILFCVIAYCALSAFFRLPIPLLPSLLSYCLSAYLVYGHAVQASYIYYIRLGCDRNIEMVYAMNCHQGHHHHHNNKHHQETTATTTAACTIGQQAVPRRLGIGTGTGLLLLLERQQTLQVYIMPYNSQSANNNTSSSSSVKM